MIVRYGCLLGLPTMIARYGCPLWLPAMVARYGCLLWLPTMIARYGCPLWLPVMAVTRSVYLSQSYFGLIVDSDQIYNTQSLQWHSLHVIQILHCTTLLNSDVWGHIESTYIIS